MSITEDERRSQLDLIAQTNRQMAERARAPGWYHGTLGLLMGGMVAVQEVGVPWNLAYYAVFAAGVALLVRGYRRHTGMWIPGYRAGRTRWVAVGGALLVGAIMLGAVAINRELNLQGACVAAGVLVAILVTIQGYLWEAAYRRDLGVR